MAYTRHIIPGEYMDAVEEAHAGILAGDIEVIDIRVLGEEEFAMMADNPTCAGVEELKMMMSE